MEQQLNHLKQIQEAKSIFRATGKTTRLVDQYVQILFTNKTLKRDKWEVIEDTSEALTFKDMTYSGLYKFHDALAKMIERRFKSEHFDSILLKERNEEGFIVMKIK